MLVRFVYGVFRNNVEDDDGIDGEAVCARARAAFSHSRSLVGVILLFPVIAAVDSADDRRRFIAPAAIHRLSRQFASMAAPPKEIKWQDRMAHPVLRAERLAMIRAELFRAEFSFDPLGDANRARGEQAPINLSVAGSRVIPAVVGMICRERVIPVTPLVSLSLEDAMRARALLIYPAGDFRSGFFALLSAQQISRRHFSLCTGKYSSAETEKRFLRSLAACFSSATDGHLRFYFVKQKETPERRNVS